MHDRRQPPAVHQRGHAARGRPRIIGQTPPYDHCNMTVDDTGAGRGRSRAFDAAPARDGLRRRRRCARCSTSRGCGSGCRDARSATRRSSRPSTRPASTTTTDMSPPPSTDPDAARLDLGSIWAPSGSTAARTCSSTTRSRRCPAGGRVARHRLRSRARRAPAGVGPAARATGSTRATTATATLVVVRGTADDDRWHGADRAGGPAADGDVAAPARARGDSPPAARSSSPAGPSRASTSTTTTWCGPTSRRGSTRRPSPASGTRRPRSPGTRRSSCRPRSRPRSCR